MKAIYLYFIYHHLCFSYHISSITSTSSIISISIYLWVSIISILSIIYLYHLYQPSILIYLSYISYHIYHLSYYLPLTLIYFIIISISHLLSVSIISSINHIHLTYHLSISINYISFIFYLYHHYQSSILIYSVISTFISSIIHQLHLSLLSTAIKHLSWSILCLLYLSLFPLYCLSISSVDHIYLLYLSVSVSSINHLPTYLSSNISISFFIIF